MRHVKVTQNRNQKKCEAINPQLIGLEPRCPSFCDDE
jgi:hypothetical protein